MKYSYKKSGIAVLMALLMSVVMILTAPAKASAAEIAGGHVVETVVAAGVNQSKLNVRALPSTSDAILTTLPAGTTINICGVSDNGWFQVVCGTSIGYVFADLVTLIPIDANVQAALGLGQIEQIEKFIQTKADNYRLYNENGISLLPFRDDIRTNYWFYSYCTDKRDEVIQYLQKNGVQSRPIWNLICNLPPYLSEMRYKIETAEAYLQKVVNIPCSTNLSAEDVMRVVNLLKAFPENQ